MDERKIEFLRIVSELNTSDSKPLQALGAEIKRLLLPVFDESEQQQTRIRTMRELEVAFIDDIIKTCKEAEKWNGTIQPEWLDDFCQNRLSKIKKSEIS